MLAKICLWTQKSHNASAINRYTIMPFFGEKMYTRILRV